MQLPPSAMLLTPPCLAQDFPSRVVVVSSLAYKFGAINLEDLHFRHRRYSRFSAYGAPCVLSLTLFPHSTLLSPCCIQPRLS